MEKVFKSTIQQSDSHAEPGAKSVLQRAAVNSAPVHSVPPIVHEVLSSPGQPLDAGTQNFMESRFGHDFSQVHIHSDAQAAQSARTMNANAYTMGDDIVFGTGQYAPATAMGRRLLAHELTHVVQQQSHDLPLATTEEAEADANMLSHAILTGSPRSVQVSAPINIAFQKTTFQKNDYVVAMLVVNSTRQVYVRTQQGDIFVYTFSLNTVPKGPHTVNRTETGALQVEDVPK